MGKIFDSLTGRSSKTARKLSMLINLAISRITIIKNLHTIKCSQAETDVIELLQLGYQERALIRVEQVIKEQNALDAYVLIENYCRLLVERTRTVKNKRECPDELEEAVATLIFAASRCGEFPELQEIRLLLTSMFGKEFVKSSTEVRNHGQVSPKMIYLFSRKEPSLEIKQNLLKQIAKHNGITLQLDHQGPGDIFQMLKSNEGATLEARKTKAIPAAEEHLLGVDEARSSEVSFSESAEANNRTRSLDDDAQSGSHHQHMQYERE